MTARPLIGLIAALLLSFVLGGAAVWMLANARTPVKNARPTLPQAQESKHHNRAERFFGGDPDRNVRGGQEMTPRW